MIKIRDRGGMEGYEMKKISSATLLLAWLLFVSILVAFFFFSKWEAAAKDRDLIRSAYRTAFIHEGEGSCGVSDDGPKVICWMERGTVKILPLKPGDRIKSIRTTARKGKKA